MLWCATFKSVSILKSTPSASVPLFCTTNTQRWNHHLHPDIRKDAWTEPEEAALVAAHRQLGNKWSDIARKLPGERFWGFGAAFSGKGGRGWGHCVAVAAAIPLWHPNTQPTVVPAVGCMSQTEHASVAPRRVWPTCLYAVPVFWHRIILRNSPCLHGMLFFCHNICTLCQSSAYS